MKGADLRDIYPENVGKMSDFVKRKRKNVTTYASYDANLRTFVGNISMAYSLVV